MNLNEVKNIDRLVNENLGEEQNLAQVASLDNINQRLANKPKANRDKKGKKKFSLYGVYSDVKVSLEQAETVLTQYIEIKNGKAVLTETGEAYLQISAEAAELLKEALAIYQDVYSEPDRIKAHWIKEKVITNRYTRRGFEIVQEFQDLGDAIFTLNGICVSIQAILINVVSKMEQSESE